VADFRPKAAADRKLKKEQGVPELLFEPTPDILAYPKDRAAYGRLCRLLSEGKMRAPKGDCILTLDDLLRWQEGLLLVVMPPHPGKKAVEIEPPEKTWNLKPELLDGLSFEKYLQAGPKEIDSLLKRLSHIAPNRVWLGAYMPYRGDDQRRLSQWQDVARAAGVKLIATNDVLYHAPERRELQDVVTCIREGVTLNEAGRRLETNAEPRIVEATLTLLEEVADRPRRALTDDHGPYARAVLDAKPAAYWRFEEIITPIAHDATGQHEATFEDGVAVLVHLAGDEPRRPEAFYVHSLSLLILRLWPKIMLSLLAIVF